MLVDHERVAGGPGVGVEPTTVTSDPAEYQQGPPRNSQEPWVCATACDPLRVGPTVDLPGCQPRLDRHSCACDCMCMSVMERRMQVLLDHERFERLAREAKRRGQSVGATVRDAIDMLLDDDADKRMSARRDLLRAPTSAAAEPEFTKNAVLEDATR